MTKSKKESICYIQKHSYKLFSSYHYDYWEKKFRKSRPTKAKPTREKQIETIKNSVKREALGEFMDLLGFGSIQNIFSSMDKIETEIELLQLEDPHFSQKIKEFQDTIDHSKDILERLNVPCY